MKYVLDVQYNGNENAVVACLGFENWEDEKASYAKAKFGNTPEACELLRGVSVKPLYITAKDMELEEAKVAIAYMHGKYRFPTLLKEVDSLARKL